MLLYFVLLLSFGCRCSMSLLVPLIRLWPEMIKTFTGVLPLSHVASRVRCGA